MPTQLATVADALRRAREGEGGGNQTAAEMLKELQQLHAIMDHCIEAIPEVVNQPNPDRNRIVDMRWRFAQARASRHFLVERICAHLGLDADPAVAEAIASVRDANRKILVGSAWLISQWTLDRVCNHWNEYRSEMTNVRSRWRANVEKEKAVLYPLLARRGL